jgi:hypothetical protein
MLEARNFIFFEKGIHLKKLEKKLVVLDMKVRRGWKRGLMIRVNW